MFSELELRTAVANTSLSQLERKEAAVHLVKMIVSTVPFPDADDPEVISVMHPWPKSISTQAVSEVMRERGLPDPTNGFSLEDARAYKHRYRKLARLKNIAADLKEDQIVRDAASAELVASVERRT